MATQAYINELSDRVLYIERKLSIFASIMIIAGLGMILSDMMKPKLA